MFWNGCGSFIRFAQVKNGGRVLDLGTGTGILPILMEAKTKAVHLTGLEIQPEMAEMAARSVKLNHLEDKIEIVEGDIKEASAIFRMIVLTRSHQIHHI